MRTFRCSSSCSYFFLFAMWGGVHHLTFRGFPSIFVPFLLVLDFFLVPSPLLIPLILSTFCTAALPSSLLPLSFLSA